ncbi:MAG: pirin family protein [Pseudomonadota bacterium]|nr:pirin family protein [Pseudomonadota bacterium]
MTTRKLNQIIPGLETSDGAGVKLRRSVGSMPGLRLDPFLMLDEFGTENPDDYIAGFPPHPHRGFETVTYMIDGHMRHEDHLGNVGELKSGGVQWMTAGRGVIHSEMPQQESGRMRGFQLWINLPAKEKMKPAGYRDIPAAQIPQATLADGSTIKVIAGYPLIEGRTVSGPINPQAGTMATDPLYIDVRLPAGAQQTLPVPDGHTALIYVYEGDLEVGGDGTARALNTYAAGVLADGDEVQVRAPKADTRFILIAGKALHEPVVQYGPFVMNTREEIEQAIDDYRRGKLAA